MKSYCIVVLALVVAAYGASSPKHEDLDIVAIVNDVKTLKSFLDCFNDVEECNELAAEFKKDMGEVIKQACSECSPAHKHNAKAFFEAVQLKLPAEYEVYKQKYDPENQYIPALIKAVADY